MSAGFASIAAALAADVKAVRLYVRVNGALVDCTDVTVSCGVDQPVSTARLTLPIGTTIGINSDIRIEAGYDGATAVIFSGRVPGRSGSITTTGRELSVDANCYTSLLAYPEATDLTYSGPISFGEMFRSLCAYRGVPAYFADDTTTPDGSSITLGGNASVDDGLVRIKAGSSPLDELRSIGKLFGFRVFGAAGATWLRKVSGAPGTTALVTYAEGTNAYSLTQSVSSSETVNFWTVTGAKYTDAGGNDITIGAKTAGSPYLAELDPPGYRAETLTDDRLVTQGMADACLAALEIDRGGLMRVEGWEADGDPRRVPGDVVAVTSATFGLSGAKRWLTDITHSISATRGYTMQCSGWAGAVATVVPKTNDCATVSVAGGPWHIGNDTVSWYAVPSPGGLSRTVSFTSPGTYASITLTGLGHGCNSVGESTATNGSAVQVWQLADPTLPEGGTNTKTMRGSAPLPVMNEEYSRQRPYGSGDTWWTSFSLNLKGDLKAGAAELRFVSTGDDYEVKSLVIAACGAGTPVAPGV